MKSFAILTDVTKCIGCEECVLACKKTNRIGLDDAPWKWQDGPGTLSATRWTTLLRTPEGRFVREQCRHCLEPACVEACPVKALHQTPEGVVAYDPTICLGCRYCILACPFRATRFEYGSSSPRVSKCVMCYDKVKSGELEQPACTAIFGERELLLAEAKRRLSEQSDLYIDHVWGEHELGGTSVLTISDVDLVQAGWPAFMTDQPITHNAHTIMQTVPWTFFGVSLGLAGVGWVIKRRQKLAQETALAGDAEGAPGRGAATESPHAKPGPAAADAQRTPDEPDAGQRDSKEIP
jgi:formate dehydrogenase iron-sulfur subunit